MAYHTELGMLLSAAIVAASAAFEEGDKTHPEGEWLSVGTATHLIHASDHIEKFIHIGVEDDLDHAIWRLLATKALLLKDRV